MECFLLLAIAPRRSKQQETFVAAGIGTGCVDRPLLWEIRVKAGKRSRRFVGGLNWDQDDQW